MVIIVEADRRVAQLALTILSPWQWYTSTRTFANSFETTLTVVALDLWPWEWLLEAPVVNKKQENVLDDGPSLESVSPSLHYEDDWH